MNPVVVITTDAHAEQAKRLATRLALPLVKNPPREPAFYLSYHQDRLQLQRTGPGAPGPVFVDFCGGKAAHRRRQGEGRRSPLARAAGMKPGKPVPRILDATAGLGQDAFVLATLGCPVLMVEQSPIIHALLEDGLQRAQQAPELAAITARLSLVRGNALDLLIGLNDADRPDSIYLDPMYPHKGKNALAKKEMRSLQLLLGPDTQGPELLEAARSRARYRTLVKRPARAGYLGQLKPDFQINSTKTRYDIYLSPYKP